MRTRPAKAWGGTKKTPNKTRTGRFAIKKKKKKRKGYFLSLSPSAERKAALLSASKPGLGNHNPKWE